MDRILLIPLWDEGNLEEMDLLIQPVIFQIRKLRPRGRMEFSASVCQLMLAANTSNSKILVDALTSYFTNLSVAGPLGVCSTFPRSFLRTQAPAVSLHGEKAPRGSQGAVVTPGHFPAHCCAQSLSRVRLFASPWTVARQARTREWVSMPFSRGSSQIRTRTQVSHIAGGFFYHLSHQGGQRVLEWIAHPFSRGSF